MDFIFLADKQDMKPVVARWYFEEWGRLREGASVASFDDKLNDYLNRDCLPLIVMAVDGDKVMGVPGSGKSTWAHARKLVEPNSIIVDAILVKGAERAPILAEAQRHGIGAIAVWFQTSLGVCLARNAARPADHVGSERGLRNINAAVEPPSTLEGFASVWCISEGDN